MQQGIDHYVLEDALRQCGSNWDASQTHGLLSGRLAIAGSDSGFDWLSQVLEGTEQADTIRDECESMLGQLFEVTYRQLTERQSGFEPLLPSEDDCTAVRATALAHWCEGFLHGLVAAHNGDELVGLDLKIDSAKRMDPLDTDAIDLAQLSRTDDHPLVSVPASASPTSDSATPASGASPSVPVAGGVSRVMKSSCSIVSRTL